MFESAELGHKIDDATYARQTKKLRPELLEAQYALLDTNVFPAIVLVNGVDGAGKGETVNLLNEWLDPRGVATHAFWGASDEESERPEYWRFWRALPGRGRIGILAGQLLQEPAGEAELRIRRHGFEALAHAMESGQRRRRYYRLTAPGRKVLASQRQGWQTFVQAMSRITGVENA